jgi:nucleoside-diphosphate-sugar epimerase
MTARVLLIGGAGYIGLVTTDHLLAAGYEVCCLDLLLYRNNACVLPFLSHPRYSFVYGDLADQAALGRALEGVDHVVLLAGLVGDPVTKKHPEASRAINDTGVQACIDRLDGNGLQRVVFVSTCSNYGLIESDEMADEDFPLRPLSLYARSKVAAEQHLLAGKGRVDYAPTVLRFATAFGLSPRMRFDLTVNEFTRELALGRDLLVFDAHTWRPYCHVKDFARLIQLTLQASADDVAFETFNAGGDANNLTKANIVDLIVRHIPSGSVRYQEHGSDARNYRVNFRKVRDTLGFQPAYTVQNGIEELLAAMHEHVFDHVDENRSFYGNYDIVYPPPQ